MGKPVVAAKHGVLPDRITDHVDGLVYDPSDVLGAAQAIDEMVNLPQDEYDAMCRAARETARARYLPENWAKRVLSLAFPDD